MWVFAPPHFASPGLATQALIRAGKTSPTWKVTEKARAAFAKILINADKMFYQYQNLEKEVTNGSIYYGQSAHIKFAKDYQKFEKDYAMELYKNNTGRTREELPYVAANAVNAFVSGAATRERFVAFMLGKQILQQEYLSPEARAADEEEFTGQCAYINFLASHPPDKRDPESGTEYIQDYIDDVLKINANNNKSYPHPNIMQQFEDLARFEGWVEDLKILGYDMSNINIREDAEVARTLGTGNSGFGIVTDDAEQSDTVSR